MCGRYQFTVNQCAEILRIAQEVERRCGSNAWQPGEVRPSALAPVLLTGSEGIHPELQNWGYQTAGSLVINARKVDDYEIKTMEDLTAVKKQYSAGDTATLTVYQRGPQAEESQQEQPPRQ